MSRRSFLRGGPHAALLIAAGVALSGCGGGEITPPAPSKSPLFPVKGTILLPDGKPLSEGTIRFLPVKQPGWMANGTIGSDGGFSLQTADQGEGAPEGEYRISIESKLLAAGGKPGQQRYAVPAAYSDPEGSDLKITVKPSPNDLGPIKLLATGPPRAVSGTREAPRD